MSKEHDRWLFYEDMGGEWCWRMTDTRNGKIIGASTEGYKNLDACEHNALRMGWDAHTSTTTVECV